MSIAAQVNLQPALEKIPLAIPDLGGNEQKYVAEAIASTWISSEGKFVDRFEHEFAQQCGVPRALSICNGTAALHLALWVCGIGPGDEVIVPSLTFIASANSVVYLGATPVFVDIDPLTWNMDPSKIAEKITPRTKAIMPVHIYGQPADMDPIMAIAREHGLYVIEDAAEATFASYKGRIAGSIGDIGSFSFYGNKVFSSGQGGALTFQDVELAEKARMIRNQGMDPNRRYYFPIVGNNFRTTNVGCAILCAQLERRKIFFEKRHSIFHQYHQLLQGIPGILFQTTLPEVVLSPWLFCILVDEAQYGRSRDALMQLLAENGIETRPFFIPLHTLPPYQNAANGPLPVTEKIGAMGMNLPTHVGLTSAHIERIADVIRQGARA